MGSKRRWLPARLLHWIMWCLAVLSMTPLLLLYNTVTHKAWDPAGIQALNMQLQYNWEQHTMDILYQNITFNASSPKLIASVSQEEARIIAGIAKPISSKDLKTHELNTSSQKHKNKPILTKPHYSSPKNSWDAQCNGIPTPVVHSSQIRKGSWQSGQDNQQVKIFSAFYDNRHKTSRFGEIQVLGMFTGKPTIKFCHLIYASEHGSNNHGESPGEELTNDHLSVHITTVTTLLASNAGGMRYRSCVFTCPLQFPGTPLGVTVVSKKCHVANSSVYLRIQDDHLIQPLYNFTVCVAPLYHTDVTNVRRFVEHVEINKILGADHFVYYNQSAGPEFEDALRLYKDLNEVVQWTLPVPTKKVIYYAQIASQNDCLLRYMYKSKYIVFTDLDEFIVPRNSTNWHDMIRQIISRKRIHASYVIRNTFFHLEFSDHPKASQDDDVQALDIMPLKKVLHEAPQKLGARSKYICDPKLTLLAWVHHIFKPMNNAPKQVYVPDDIAMLHHYRNWQLTEGSITSFTDMNMYRFRDLIVSNIRAAHRKLGIAPIKRQIHQHSNQSSTQLSSEMNKTAGKIFEGNRRTSYFKVEPQPWKEHLTPIKGRAL